MSVRYRVTLTPEERDYLEDLTKRGKHSVQKITHARALLLCDISDEKTTRTVESVTEHRTKIDWAQQIKEMLDVRYPDATKVVLVMDNLNTHATGSLICGVPARGNKTFSETTGDPLHAKAWQLAEDGRD